MSKVDAQRAMKAARQVRSAASGAGRPAATPPVPSGGAAPAGRAAAPGPAAGTRAPGPSAPGAPDAVTDANAPVTAPEPGACGHRNMAGKECRRPAGHPEKSHRYA